MENMEGENDGRRGKRKVKKTKDGKVFERIVFTARLFGEITNVTYVAFVQASTNGQMCKLKCNGICKVR